MLRSVILGRVAVPIGCRSFQSSAVDLAKQSYLKRIRRIQKHVAGQMLKSRPEAGDPVMGKPNTPFLERVKARVSEEFNYVDGVSVEDTEKLMFGAEQASVFRSGEWLQPEIEQEGAKKREVLSRIISMQNASQSQIRKFALSLAIKEFGRFDGDTGSSEVQAAVATINIQYVANHLKENIHDYASQKKLQALVQGRQAILKYLKRTNPQRYFWAIEKLGLTDASVTSEFSLSRKYFETTQFFGDRTLPVRITKPEMRRIRRADALKKKAKKFLADQKS